MYNNNHIILIYTVKILFIHEKIKHFTQNEISKEIVI